MNYSIRCGKSELDTCPAGHMWWGWSKVPAEVTRISVTLPGDGGKATNGEVRDGIWVFHGHAPRPRDYDAENAAVMFRAYDAEGKLVGKVDAG